MVEIFVIACLQVEDPVWNCYCQDTCVKQESDYFRAGNELVSDLEKVTLGKTV